MERKRNSGKRYFIWSIAKQMRVFEGRLSAERGSSLSGKQKRRTQNGEYKMENTKSHTPVALRKQIGGTMYVVRVYFNEDAKEIMKDKIKRLIENDVRGTQHTA